MSSNERSTGIQGVVFRKLKPGTLRRFGEGEFMPVRSTPRFDSKLDGILRQAAEVFRDHGYDRASIRDISRSTGVSLSGLYYYFSSKEHLLYLIQRHAFETLLAEAQKALAPVVDPEERLRVLVALHMGYFIEHPSEMKVLTHEETALGDEWRREIHAIKKNYFQLGRDVIEGLRRAHSLKGINTRLSVLSLFGMMNWIYTWYNPKVDPGAQTMAREMSDLFLRGILNSGRTRVNGWGRDSGRGSGAHSPRPPAARHRWNGSRRRHVSR